MKASHILRLVVLAAILASTVGCDQASKHVVRTTLRQAGAVRALDGLLTFTLTENPGAFLSLGSSLPQRARAAVFTAGVGLGLVLVFVYLTTSATLSRWSFLGLALFWAGGVSNLIDRLTRDGLVTDFLVVRVGPFQTGIFNLADVVITIGAALLVLSLRKPVPDNGAPPDGHAGIQVDREVPRLARRG